MNYARFGIIIPAMSIPEVVLWIALFSAITVNVIGRCLERIAERLQKTLFN